MGVVMVVTRVARILRAALPVVDVELTDGGHRTIDLSPYLSGEIFEPVRTDPGYFAHVRVDPVFRTLCWPNGADVDPDVLSGNRPLA